MLKTEHLSDIASLHNGTSHDEITRATQKVGLALTAKAHPDQKRIAERGILLIDLLLRKNADYGSSAWKPPRLCPDLPASQAILVRLSDKLERLEQLLQGKTAEVADEPIEATIEDTAGYLLLWLARPADEAEETTNETSEVQ
ncbi:hypothetical protein GYB59_00670 [bacterium]|nr:hypothetical protein [bacterium]